MAVPPSTSKAQSVPDADQLRAELTAARAQLDKVTARLREQEAFSRRVERAREGWAQVADALAQPVFIHDESGSIVRANRAYAQRAGVSVTNLVGKVYWKLFPEQDGPFSQPEKAADPAEFEFSPSGREVFLVRSVGASAGLPPGWRFFVFQDITALKQAEDALRVSGQYARSIVESSHAVIVAVDRDRRIIEFNPAAEQAFGYGRDEVLGRHATMLYANPDAADAVRNAVFERQGVICEVENRRKSGEAFTSLLSAAALRDEGGRALGILGISFDIGKRKRAEAQMREALSELELILENAAAGIMLTEDRALKRVNRRFAEILGYEKEELSGKSMALAFSAREDYEKLVGEAYPELAKGDNYEAVTQFRRKDGALLRVRLAGRAVGRGKESAAAIWVVDDLTARKAEEAELERSATYFRALVEHGNDVVTVVDGEGAIRYESPAVEDVLGYSVSERIGRSNFEFVHPDDAARVREWHQRVLQGKTRREKAEYRVRHRDGNWRIVEAMASRIAGLGAEAMGAISLRDVTEHRRGERQFARSMEGMIAAIAAAFELRNFHAAGHQRAVAALAMAIGQEMGLEEERARGLYLAGIVHDIGEVQVPAEILMKPARLSEVEHALIKTHPQAAYEILKDIDLPWPIAQIVLQHHELLDGSGYPRGLVGEEILLEARILTVADVVEAMASHRPHRPAADIDAALAEIARFRGAKFDPQAVDACARLFREKGYTFKKG
jgi:PAS domain S-box-containing protein